MSKVGHIILAIIALGLVLSLAMPILPVDAGDNEVIELRGRASRTYQTGENTYQTVFTSSPEFTKSADGGWVNYAFTDYGDYYAVQHPWWSVAFYDYYTMVYDETFTEVKIYDDRWVVEYLNKRGRWTDAGFWNVAMAYEVVGDGIKLTRSGDTDIGQRQETYYFRNGSPCKIEIKQTCDQAQTIRFVWKPSGIVADTERQIVPGEYDKHAGKVSGLNYYDSVGDFVSTLRWYDELDICDSITPVVEAGVQGRKATITFGDFASDAGDTIVLDPDTFYPDPHVEITTVDGRVMRDVRPGTDTWVNIRNGAGTTSNDDDTTLSLLNYECEGGGSDWEFFQRSVVLFDTSGLPDDCTVTDAVLSIFGKAKADAIGIAPASNVYSSDPASNTALIAADYGCLGTEDLATEIAYADWSVVAYNDFTLIDVNTDGFATNADGTYINKTGVTKLGLRDSTYDAPNNVPDPAYGGTKVQGYTAEQGAPNKPKLVITYSEGEPPPPPPPPAPARFTVTRISNTEINASWADCGVNVTYLIKMSLVDFPVDPEGDEVTVYAGNLTSCNSTGHNFDLNKCYFSLWSHTNPYSGNVTWEILGGEQLEQLADAMEDYAATMAFFVVVIKQFVVFVPLILFSVLAFWKSNAILFMLVAGTALITGLYWYDAFTDNLGLTIGLMLLLYALACVAFAFRMIFWREIPRHED